MNSQPTRLDIRMEPDPGDEADAIAEAAGRLRRELLDLDVDAVDVLRSEAAPPGSRGGEAAVLGALVVTVTQAQLLPAVVDTVKSWILASRQRSVRLELDGDVLELGVVSADEQRRLTDEWLRRHQAT